MSVRMRGRKICLVVGALLMLLHEGSAQTLAVANAKTKVNQNLYWTRYFSYLEFSPKWVLETELDNRRFMTPHAHRQHQTVLRTHLHYGLSKGWDVALGGARFFQFPQDPASPSTLVVPEWRYFVEVNQKNSLGKVQVRQRHRMEQRFFHRVEGGQLASGHLSNFRFRYQAQADISLVRKPGTGRGSWGLRVSDEIMFNFGQNIVRNSFDQNRIYAGIRYQALDQWTTELGYLHWFQQQPAGNVYYDRDIVRLTVFHRVRLWKEQ